MKCISLKLLIAAVALNIVLMPLNNTMAVLCGYVILMSSAVLPFEMMIKSENRMNRKQAVLIVAFLLVVVFNSLTSLFSLQMSGLENLVKAFISFFAFMWAISVGGMQYTEKDLNFYFAVNRFLAIVFVAYTILPFGFQYTVTGDYGYMQFTLSMGNPNATATKVMFSAMLLVIQSCIVKRKRTRRINALLIIGVLYTLIRLESRTAFFCTLVGIFLGIVLKYRVTKRTVNTVWLIPAVFIPIQLALEKFPVLVLLGKTLVTGRETMYTEFFNEIQESPLSFVFGSFIDNGLANYHNIFFTILFNFGFVGILLYLSFWRTESKRIVSDSNNKITNFAWIAMVVFIVQSMAEAAAMSGGFTFGAIIILLNRLTKDEFVVSPQEEDRYDLIMKPRAKWLKRRSKAV